MISSYSSELVIILLPFINLIEEDDNSVVYAVSSDKGIKGVIDDAYGAYSESLSFEMLSKLKTK